ncbi:flagellar export protein FliJ [Psychromonas sp. psych-6C06]|uniref:flagellar export protein FliJ n=1 Tax=Psychromonas sp. psych-6C06 TaxID=2058089 RepID=UPI000C33CE05|nr:flagellar export protein FliJ [Psychromonas sp. psych-6C06]PKF62943.1 flagellar export protein FliJ [Psychromonas sp. psych-6C06]
MARDALQLVYEQREKQVEQALQAYQRAQQTLFEQRQQLQNLHQYRRQYISQLSEKGSQGLSIADLGKYQQFIVQIDQGVTQHQQGLIKFEYDVQAHKKMWVEAQVSCKAMGMLLEKKALKKRRLEDKKEQVLMDEFTTFQHFQKQSGL